jgi:hypothetical protein
VTGQVWTHPCHMVWDLAGRPAPKDPPSGDGVCGLCAASGVGHGKLGPNFTDRRIQDGPGDLLCAACTWVLGGKPPATLRMWTLVARTDRPCPPSQPTAHACGEFLHATNRKDTRWVAATLADPPDGQWLVTYAESGQKHTLPFATVNVGGGAWTVRVDGADVTSTPGQWRTVLAHTAALRSAGFSAAAIESGQPPIVALKGNGLALWRAHFDGVLAPFAGSGLLHLTNLMITKETSDHYITTYPTR